MTAAADASDRFRLLSNPRQRLLRMMQRINFGRIAFGVLGGEPDLGRPWSILRTVKLAGGNNGPRTEAASVDFDLCKEHISLLAQLAQITDGARVAIEVKHGLPFLMEIEQDHQAA